MAQKISASLEDYLEGILILQKQNKVVRVRDLAKLINVKAPSVIEAISNLKKKQLVHHERYGYIELTEEGLKMAEVLYSRHTLLTRFFQSFLAIDPKVAEEDACKIEHYLSKTTIDRIIEFMNFTEKEDSCKLIKEFHSFIKTK